MGLFHPPIHVQWNTPTNVFVYLRGLGFWVLINIHTPTNVFTYLTSLGVWLMYIWTGFNIQKIESKFFFEIIGPKTQFPIPFIIVPQQFWHQIKLVFLSRIFEILFIICAKFSIKLRFCKISISTIKFEPQTLKFKNLKLR
jgi:hypothetical protein